MLAPGTERVGGASWAPRHGVFVAMRTRDLGTTNED